MRKMHVILQFVKQNAFYLSEGWVGGTKGEKFYLKKGQIPLKIYLSSFIPFSVMTTLKQRHTACFSIATFTLPREKKLYIRSMVLFPWKVAKILVCECRKTRHANVCMNKVKITGRYSVLLSLQTNCIV